MKKTCNNCKALENFGCSLGYKVEKKTKFINDWPIVVCVPKGECPKPKTIKEYIGLYNNKLGVKERC